jgi:hypothetical protein
MVSLLEHIRQLESRDNRARGDYVLEALSSMGIGPLVQERRWPAIRNIIADLAPPGAAGKRLFCAHYDTAKGSPGANDNASGVAVLLGLCHRLKETAAAARVVFFDREEGTSTKPVLRMGLLGSLYYIWKNSLKDITAVYNLEFCGQGNTLAIWPVGRRGDTAAVRGVEKVATRLAIPWRRLDMPWALQSSDHLPFRLAGYKEVISLSMLPGDGISLLKERLEGATTAGLLAGRRPELPEPFSFFHTGEDTSARLSEEPLQTMLSVVLELAGGDKADSPAG